MQLETITGTTAYPTTPTTIATVVGNAWEAPPTTILNEYSVMTLPAFQSAVRFLEETIGGLPRRVVKNTNGYREPVDHPLNKLLNRKCNGYARPNTVFGTTVHHTSIWGNGYLAIERDKQMRPIALHNVNPEIVSPFLMNGQKWFYITAPAKDPEDKIRADADMIHIMLTGYNSIWGYPLVYLMKQNLDAGRQAELHTVKFFANGSFMRGAVEIPGVLTADQRATLMNSLERYKGAASSNSFGLMVLEAAAKLNNSTLPNQTAQLIETRQFHILDVCRMLRVAPHVVYHLGDAKWANIDQMSTELVKYSLSSWIKKFSEELTSKLLTEQELDKGLEICLDIDELLKGDPTTLIDNVNKLVLNGHITRNEGRAKLGLPKSTDPQADKLSIPVSFPTSQPQQSPAPSPQPSPAAKPQPQYSAIVEPLLIDACQRVETKTAKAFERRTTAPEAELSKWADQFANEQKKYVLDAFKPLAEAISGLGGSMDIEKVADQYAIEIAKYAATKTKRDLLEIARSAIGEIQ